MHDVLIAGGGHAGLFLAAALAGLGFDVAVAEPEPVASIRARTDNGRSLALMQGSRAVAERHGLWPNIAAEATPVVAVEVFDTASGARVLYDSRELGEAPFGYGLRNARLRTALLDAALERGVPLVASGIEGWRRATDHGVATLADGSEIGARLIVGADGRGSPVRQLAGIELERWAYDQAALTFAVRHAEPHGNRVRERLRPAGPLALLPVGPKVCGVTWVESGDEAQRLAALPAAELLATLSEATDNVLGDLELEGAVQRYPLSAQHARRYVASRLALVGDAAHGVHPIHAQGLNMGVADVGALCAALVEARARGCDPGSAEALLPYERSRRGQNAALITLTDGMNRIFSSDLAPLRFARGLGLRAIESVPPLKRLAVRRGMGVANA